MLWADEAGRTRRPIVAIDDHLYHTGELLTALAATAPELLSQITVCALDRPGPDTDAVVGEWTVRYPQVGIVTLAGPRGLGAAGDDYGSCAREIARLVRPGGIVLQDIQLETLAFIPADRWWESIYLGAAIRGFFPERPPVIRFCSNKRGYDATFGKDLLDAGFDPRDVMDKTQVATVVVPALRRLFAAQFPRSLRTTGTGDVSVGDLDRADVERQCDVVLWRSSAGASLGGRAVGSTATLKAGSPEVQTWQQLIDDHLAGGDGVAVVDIGARLADAGAERAEQTNLAARHLHGLRSRLRDSDAIVTAHHRYRLRDGLTAAIV
jgi:hypothetical protein